MKDRKRLEELARAHGIKTTKRVFVEDVKERKTVFVDLPKPPKELARDLADAGVEI